MSEVKRWYLVHVELSRVEDVLISGVDEKEALERAEQLVRDNLAGGYIDMVAESVIIPERRTRCEIDRR